MEFVSAIPFGKALAFYRICRTYQNAFLATLEKYVGGNGNEHPPLSVFFIKNEEGCLGDAAHQDLIQHLATSIDMQTSHNAVLDHGPDPNKH